MLKRQSPISLCLVFFYLIFFSACKKESGIDWNYLHKHYAENPSDSLKLAALAFYQKNLPGITSEVLPISDMDGSLLTLKDMAMHNYNVNSIPRPFNSEDYRSNIHLQHDSEILTSDQIRKYIDEGFESWNNAPWKKDVPREIFLEYLRPYKIFNDYPSDWWSILKQHLIFGYKTYLDTCTLIDKKNNIVFIDSLINKFVIPQNSNGFTYDENAVKIGNVPSFQEIALQKRGDCFYEAATDNYLMKSVGIPSGFNFIPYWGNVNGGHAVAIYWNTGQQKMRLSAAFSYKSAKVFHRTFRNYQLWDKKIKPVVGQSRFDLEFLKTNYVKDVTRKHVATADIEVSISPAHSIKLASINSGKESFVKSNSSYTLQMMGPSGDLVTIEKKTCLKDSTISFKNVPNARFYELIEEGSLKPLSRPFAYISNQQLWH